MKKGKISILTMALLTIFFLAACGNQKNSATSSSKKTTSEKIASSKNSRKEKSTLKSSTSIQSDSVSTSDKVSSSTSSSSTMDKSNSSSRLELFNKQLRAELGTVILPTVDGLGTGSDKLNIRYVGTKDNYTVNYSVGNVARNVNDAAVSKEVPYAQFKKITYNTTADASAQVNYLSQDNLNGLETVDLGNNITGYVDAGAGQRYLSWHEGNWSLTVHATAVTNQDPKLLATQIVDMLEEYSLPAPLQHGTITADMGTSYGSKNQIITWQMNNVVYQLSAHDITTAIKMAASSK